MKSIQDTIIVNAPIHKVWEAIQDPKTHAQWHPFVTHIGGEHAPGAMRQCSAERRTVAAWVPDFHSSFRVCKLAAILLKSISCESLLRFRRTHNHDGVPK